MELERFESLVEKAVLNLPEEFQERLDNIDIVVEEEPSPEQLKKSRLEKGMTLLGLYEGVPLTERSSYYGMVIPDKITIYQKPIEEMCRSESEIIREVASVVQHEIAHHFGISDARLDELQKRKKRRG